MKVTLLLSKADDYDLLKVYNVYLIPEQGQAVVAVWHLEVVSDLQGPLPYLQLGHVLGREESYTAQAFTLPPVRVWRVNNCYLVASPAKTFSPFELIYKTRSNKLCNKL